MTLTPKEKQQIENWESILNDRRSVGPKRHQALTNLINLAKEKTGKDIRSKKEALLALDWIEPTLPENKNIKLKELRKLIREEISNNPYDLWKGKHKFPSTQIRIDLDLSDYERNQLENLLDLLEYFGKMNSSEYDTIKDYIQQTF